jgi:hypothetical protein
VDICGFSGMLLVVGVEFLLRMKVSMSGWGGVSGLLSTRIWLFDANSSILELVDDISLVFRTFSGGGKSNYWYICLVAGLLQYREESKSCLLVWG